MGYMYEDGIGVPADLHMAKRYYDLAALKNPGTLSNSLFKSHYNLSFLFLRS